METNRMMCQMQPTGPLHSRLLNRLALNSTAKHSHNKDFYTGTDTTDRADKQQQHSRDSYGGQFIATGTHKQ